MPAYWSYKSFQEVRDWRGEGVNGWIGMLLSLTIIGNFLLPSYVGRMYKAEWIRRGEDPLVAGQKVPITGLSGFFILIPPWPVGSLIWLARVQGKLNDFWNAGTPPPEAVDSPLTPA